VSTKREIYYFEKAGTGNTKLVAEAVKKRVIEGGIKHIIVASLSGNTALQLAEAIKGLDVQLVCVTGPPHYPDSDKVTKENRKRLNELSVKVVDKTPSPFEGFEFSLARYGFTPATWAVIETLEAIGGYGLKTAVEAAIMATDAGEVPSFEEVIAVGGTAEPAGGADTAIVMRSVFSSTAFSKDPKKRFEVYEIIAMPRSKKWYSEIGTKEGFFVQETF